MNQPIKTRTLPAPDNALALRLPEVARSIGTSRRFLEKQIAAGHLRALKLSARCVRIRPADLADWMERRAV